MYSVSIVVTTKNRKEELSKCIDSCLLLNGVYEIFVFDDGSSDGTYDFVKLNYPTVSLYRTEESLGLINARTRCGNLAKGDVIVSIDDDCIFQGTDTILEIMKFFSHDKIVALTIPIVDVLVSNEVSQKGIGKLNDIFVCSQFRGGAHAIKRDIFIELGGYYNKLIRQEEETEFGMKLYAAGYYIRIADCSHPIHHYHSTNRNPSLIAFYRSRNQFLVNYMHVPSLLLPITLFKQSLQTIIYEIKNKQLKACFSGYKNALKNIITGNIKRNPMQLSKYISYKKLRMKNFQRINL